MFGIAKKDGVMTHFGSGGVEDSGGANAWKLHRCWRPNAKKSAFKGREKKLSVTKTLISMLITRFLSRLAHCGEIMANA